MPIKIELETLEDLTGELKNIVGDIEKIKSTMTEPEFYTISEVSKILGWSEPTVQELFNRGDFPSCDFGRRKIVEKSTFLNYFSVPRRK